MAAVKLVLVCTILFICSPLVWTDHDDDHDDDNSGDNGHHDDDNSSDNGDHVQYRPGQCLVGDKHKELPCPEPESPQYTACLQWQNKTCCTAEFSQQLANPNVSGVDNFRWDVCTPLSDTCQDFFVSVECFYRCSPNVAHWRNPFFRSAVKQLPVCREFCDNWFTACAGDMTCATNWVTDWVYVEDVNLCKNATCRTFSEVYRDGRGLCETLWGESFVYSNDSESDPDRHCMTLTPWDQGVVNPNQVALANLFGSQVNTTQPVACSANAVHTVGFVWNILLAVVVCLGGVVLQ